MPTILIVDDESAVRHCLAMFLGLSGYRLQEAADGAEALERVQAERPDLVISDIFMPRMDGFEFVRRLRSDPDIARTPVVFITGAFQEEEARPLAQACGVTHLITKPPKPDAILHAVGLALSTPAPAQAPPLPETFHGAHLCLLTNKITEKMKEVEAMNRRLLDAHEAERSRLARELHDELGQLLATVNYRLDAAKALAGPAVLPQLEECSAILQQATAQVRNLSFELRPVLLEVLGLEAALHYLAEHHRARAGQEVEIQLAPVHVASEQAIACFRIVQEGLVNVARHAQAKRVRVELGRGETGVKLVIHDDGIGFDVAQVEQHAQQIKSFGLLGMKERANLLGGRLEIESAPGLGTTLHLHLPVSERE
jgi:signal transduction histidine kinase